MNLVKVGMGMMVLRTVLAVSVVAALSVPVNSLARQPRGMPGSQKAMVVGQRTFEMLQQAQEAMAEERYDESLRILGKMESSKRLNANEEALMWHAFGNVYVAQEDYVNATESLEKCVAAEGLNEQAALTVRYNLAQLYLMQERYDDAIPMLTEWFEKVQNPAPSAYYAMAVAYVQTDDRDKAFLYAKQAVAKSEEPREGWLQLLLGFYLEDKEYGEAKVLLEQLTTRFPKKLYWVQLSAVYSALDDSKNALAVLELAYLQDLLTEEGELVHLAQLYFYNGIPYEAALVLEKGLESGAIEGDADSWELLANSWLYARERKRAVEPLRRAANLSDKGDLYVRLASVWMEQEEWSKAADALRAALAKGGVSDPGTTHLMLGIANASAKRWEDANTALTSAKKFEKTEKAATQWIARLEHEKRLMAN
jgi:tetratricopeptide (TPR) repeat protein